MTQYDHGSNLERIMILEHLLRFARERCGNDRTGLEKSKALLEFFDDIHAKKHHKDMEKAKDSA